MDESRDEILTQLRAALSSSARSPIAPLPSTTRIPPRSPGDPESELSMFLSEVEKLGGFTRRLSNASELRLALQELVRKENIRTATCWNTPAMHQLQVFAILTAAGVTMVQPDSPSRQLAACDLGITGVDAALPETGTLVLRSSLEHPQLVSLLPRVHLAILEPEALRSDMQKVFSEIKSGKRAVLITGPSRTTDIEKVLTIGVHGPKALYVWFVQTQSHG